MFFREINPYARYVRDMELTEKSHFDPYYPLDGRLFFLAEGEGVISVYDSIYTLLPGDLLYINAGTPYHLKPCSARYIAVNFDFTFAHSHLVQPVPPLPVQEVAALPAKEGTALPAAAVTALPAKEAAALPTEEMGALSESGAPVIERCIFSDITQFNDFCLFRNCRFLELKLQRLKAEYEKKLPFFELEASSTLRSVLIDLARFLGQRDTRSTNFNMDKVITYIHAHFSEDLDNRSLAKMFNYHPNYLSAEFRRCMGMSLHTYLLQTRISKSITLLESGELSVTEIAAVCGFSDANYIARYFKKVVGCSPTQFGKRQRTF